ncbi:MAG: hypothetical protein WBD20_19375 [Pirellulaceae bacterium]
MPFVSKLSAISFALLLAGGSIATDAQAQRRGSGAGPGASLSRGMGSHGPGSHGHSGRSLGAPGISRGMPSSIGARAAGPSSFHAGPSPGLSRSFGSSSRYSSPRYTSPLGSSSSRFGYSSGLYGSSYPRSGLSISIGGGYSPSLRYGSLGSGYGLGYSSLGYSSTYGSYSSGYGYSPYYYSARPSIGLNLYSSPSLYSSAYPSTYPSYVAPYSSPTNTYPYTQPVSPYTSSPYETYRQQSAYVDSTLNQQPTENPYVQTSPATERATGDPSDPSTVLHAGMILPDGSRIISVGALPAAGSVTEQPTQLTPAQGAPVDTSGQSVLQPTPAPADIKPAAPNPADPNPADSEPVEASDDFEELPIGNVQKAEDV